MAIAMLAGHAFRTGEWFEWCGSIGPRDSVVVRSCVIAPMARQNVLFDKRGRNIDLGLAIHSRCSGSEIRRAVSSKAGQGRLGK